MTVCTTLRSWFVWEWERGRSWVWPTQWLRTMIHHYQKRDWMNEQTNDLSDSSWRTDSFKLIMKSTTNMHTHTNTRESQERRRLDSRRACHCLWMRVRTLGLKCVCSTHCLRLRWSRIFQWHWNHCPRQTLPYSAEVLWGSVKVQITWLHFTVLLDPHTRVGYLYTAAAVWLF